MRRPAVIAIASGVVTAGVLAAVLVPVLISAAATPEDAIALLAEPQQADDTALPVAGQFELDPASVRFVGEDEDATFWAAIDTDGDVCVVVMLPDETGGAGCSPLSVFRTSGTMVGLFSAVGSGTSIRVHLLPDAADTSGDVGPWHRVGDNLLWADPSDLDDEQPVEIPRDDGGAPFVLGP